MRDTPMPLGCENGNKIHPAQVAGRKVMSGSRPDQVLSLVSELISPAASLGTKVDYADQYGLSLTCFHHLAYAHLGFGQRVTARADVKAVASATPHRLTKAEPEAWAGLVQDFRQSVSTLWSTRPRCKGPMIGMSEIKYHT